MRNEGALEGMVELQTITKGSEIFSLTVVSTTSPLVSTVNVSTLLSGEDSASDVTDTMTTLYPSTVEGAIYYRCYGSADVLGDLAEAHRHFEAITTVLDHEMEFDVCDGILNLPN